MNPSMGLESRIHTILTPFPWVVFVPADSNEGGFFFPSEQLARFYEKSRGHIPGSQG